MEDKGYKDKKEFICTGCGCTEMATKFASQKTFLCKKCKENGVQVNPKYVEMALQKNPPKVRTKSDSGPTKIRPCIKCGEQTEVSKFMSDQKVLCNKCKGVEQKSARVKISVDKSKLKYVKIAPIEDYEMNSGVIANKRLREVKCPACGHEYMKPLSVIDWSQFGLVISYQCQNCYTTIELSEQQKRPLKIHSPSKRFDYTGTEIKDLGISMRQNSRMANALCILIDRCEKNNIDIEGIFEEFSESLPPYRYKNEMPVKKGFVIPPEDRWVDTVHQIYELFKNARRVGSDEDIPEGSRNIVISETLANNLADKLKLLLEGEQNGAE